MVIYINTHAAIEQMREKAEKEVTRGPRVITLPVTNPLTSSVTVKTLKIGSPRLTTVVIFNIKQFDFTMQ